MRDSCRRFLSPVPLEKCLPFAWPYMAAFVWDTSETVDETENDSMCEKRALRHYPTACPGARDDPRLCGGGVQWAGSQHYLVRKTCAARHRRKRVKIFV